MARTERVIGGPLRAVTALHVRLLESPAEEPVVVINFDAEDDGRLEMTYGRTFPHQGLEIVQHAPTDKRGTPNLPSLGLRLKTASRGYAQLHPDETSWLESRSTGFLYHPQQGTAISYSTEHLLSLRDNLIAIRIVRKATQCTHPPVISSNIRREDLTTTEPITEPAPSEIILVGEQTIRTFMYAEIFRRQAVDGKLSPSLVDMIEAVSDYVQVPLPQTAV